MKHSTIHSPAHDTRNADAAAACDSHSGRSITARAVARGMWGTLVGLVSTLVLSVAMVNLAEAGTVTQVINCPVANSLSASVAELTLGAVNVSGAAQSSPGTLKLTATEMGCAAQGWKVTIQSSEWTRQGGGPAIPASAFAVMQVASPSPVSGQGIDPAGGPKLVNDVGTLDHARKVLQTNVGYGLGTYSQVLGVNLTIPGSTLPGTYQALVTTTITAGP